MNVVGEDRGDGSLEPFFREVLRTAGRGALLV